MNGQIPNSVGFTSVDGPIRQLTLRERLQQIINLGQPSVIIGVEYTVEDARRALLRYKDSILDTQIN